MSRTRTFSLGPASSAGHSTSDCSSPEEIRIHTLLPDGALKAHRLAALSRLRGHATELITRRTGDHHRVGGRAPPGGPRGARRQP